MRWKTGIVFLMVVLYLQPGFVGATESNQFTPSADDLTLIIDFGNGTTLRFENVEGHNVLDATNGTVDVEGEWYVDRIFVTSIAGVANDDDPTGRWWQFWVNDELGPIAANKYVVKEGDIVEWKFIASQVETDSEPNYDLLFSASVLAVMGVGFLALLFTKMR